MKNKAYFVRHGENYANEHHILSYKLVDLKLTQKGEVQVAQTAAYFADKSIDKIYSSPLIRAFQTGCAIMETSQAPLEIIEILREVNIGMLEETPMAPEAWTIHNQVYADWFDDKKKSRFPDGESYYDLANRFKQMLIQVLQNHENQEIVFSGHGGMFLIGPRETFPNLFDETNFKRMVNCGIGIMEIELKDGELSAEMIDWNYTEHLSDEFNKIDLGFEEKIIFKK